MKLNKFVAIGMMVLSLAACSKKQNTAPDGGVTDGAPVTGGDISSNAADSDSGNAMGIETIRFPFDSFEIVGENREILRKNVKILKDNPNVNVQIEGHCDERGGIQYNLALGEKRANAVKSQVVAAGIAGTRVTTISMGKEKPVASGSGEEAWAQNRRANFAITAR